jgi:CubicO group peptidase (beta-lactamase class C family)
VAEELAKLQEIDDLILDEMARWNVPGVSIGIYNAGVYEEAAYGVANIETRQPVVPETLFQIGSISKVFTATTVMSLVEEGKLDLDIPVITYVPDLPLADETARKTITLRHLLSHMSGFYGDRFDDHGDGDDALEKAVAAFGDLPQQTAPGELMTYCNAGFDLTGRAIELVTGQRFEDVVRERIFNPLGMEKSTYFAKEAIRHAVAVGHATPPGGETKVCDPWPIPRRSGPAGAISSNVGELIRFARMHLNGGELDGVRVLSQESTAAMQEFQTKGGYPFSWGIGWVLSEVGGAKFVQHNGGTNGFLTRLMLQPERDFALAVFTNGSNGDVVHGKVATVILDRFLGLRNTPPEKVTLSDDALAKLAGTYKHGLAKFTLSVDNGGFHVERTTYNPFSPGESTEQLPFRAEPIADDLFIVVDGELAGAAMEFFFNGDGSVRFLRTGNRLGYPVR